MCNALFLYIDNAAGSESSLACIGYLINDCNDIYGLDMQFDAYSTLRLQIICIPISTK